MTCNIHHLPCSTWNLLIQCFIPFQKLSSHILFFKSFKILHELNNLLADEDKSLTSFFQLIRYVCPFLLTNISEYCSWMITRDPIGQGNSWKILNRQILAYHSIQGPFQSLLSFDLGRGWCQLLFTCKNFLFLL